jgi:hypothetical protein
MGADLEYLCERLVTNARTRFVLALVTSLADLLALGQVAGRVCGLTQAAGRRLILYVLVLGKPCSKGASGRTAVFSYR